MRTAPPVAGACAVLVMAVAGCGGGHGRDAGRNSSAAAQRGPGAVLVEVAPNAPTTPIPQAFLGLSLEWWNLPFDDQHLGLFRRVIELLHVPGDGPLVVRVGGDSSDHTLFDPQVRRLPSWAYGLTRAFVVEGARDTRKLGVRVIIDLNLITATPKRAGVLAAEAQRVMPRGSVIGYEIGNEPDLYTQAFWVAATQGDRTLAPSLPPSITPASYARQYNEYAGVMDPIARGTPLLAPALANPRPDLDFIRTLLAGPHPGLGVVTGHRYPYSACATRRSPEYPTIPRVLSENATFGMAQSVEPMVVLARRAGLAARLTEFNSVTCGGLAGVSNTFATSLWAPDAIFELIRDGFVGINLHARHEAVNGPFTFDIHGFDARPLLYGLMTFVRTLGPRARLVTVQRSIPTSVPLKAWAVEVSGHQLHVLLINKGPRSETVSLRIPASRPATLQRLLAPSVSARSGVTLAGQSLDANGNWSGKRQIQVVAPGAAGYQVTAPPYSATLLSVPLNQGALQ